MGPFYEKFPTIGSCLTLTFHARTSQSRRLSARQLQQLQWTEAARVVVEVSPHEIADKLSGKNPPELDTDWIRCEVDVSTQSLELAGEKITQQVASAGGKIRLLHPVSDSLESTYLRYIHEAESQE